MWLPTRPNSEGTSYGDDVYVYDFGGRGRGGATSLSLTIACAQETAIVGDRLTFEIGLENSGDGAATDVIVEVPLPDSVEFVSAAVCDGRTGPADRRGCHRG